MVRAICLCALLTAGAAAAKVEIRNATPEEKQATTKVLADFSDAWSRHDAQAIAGLFTADGDLVNPMGRTAIGREQIARLVGDEHAGRLKSSTIAHTCERVRFYGAEVAQVDCTYTVTGMQGPQTSLSGLSTTLLVKEDGVWKMAAHRPMVPRVAPSAAAGRRGPPTGRAP